MQRPTSSRRSRPAAPRARSRGRRAALTAAAAAFVLPLLSSTAPAGAAPGDTDRMDKLNKQIEQLDKEYGGDLAELKDAQWAARKAIKKADELRGQLEASRTLVARLAANQYMTGGQDPGITVIAAGDPSELLNTMSLASHVARNQSARVQQISKLVADQEKARQQAQAKIAGLQKNLADLKSRKAQIKKLVKKYKPESPSVGMGNVTPRMLHVKQVIDTEFGPFPTIGCYRGGADAQDHATGTACDFMESSGGSMPTSARNANGDQVAAYAIAHASSLGIKYIIWKQRIYDMRRPGWHSMSDRGGITANHYDHVHISVF
ncbi:hypothetical protein DZF91_06490 [Actinomadura logoneensis]|uniref:ARB-07466-like C-terminal domain-containing protein n=1 Tax=Actinomadura logoneensis TaxID=2293572 RepID=A0A372JR59_9ACTN|nr:hypothetical protein [Actinomadura logoneensis]RFU42450.1 hypothetical protein DZF91_06490 [Actinomadura logoneensis]